MPLRASTKFAIVVFKNYTLKNGKQAVELVPRSWLYENQYTWFCVYPPSNDYKFVSDWVKSEKDPDIDWIAYELELLKEARNYEQGMRRLEKSFEVGDISSSDMDEHIGNGVDAPQRVLESAEAEFELDELPPPPVLEKPAPTNSRKRANEVEVIETEEPVNKKSRALITKKDLEELETNLSKKINRIKANIQYDLREFLKNLNMNMPIFGGCRGANSSDVPFFCARGISTIR
ncbi:uncharacterized protein LOC103315584 [Nasonia vitripennis]|uniref:Uncharacterized protein n=1 Tax=Nasonia vitripennis TaxID=7425 RepID=A0A7M7H303_NASVI|nr:uncharacterized protein LOC103315584 [Nasonia vitripennis]